MSKFFNIEVRSYIKKLSLLTGIFGFLTAFTYSSLLVAYYHPFIPLIILYFYLFNVLQHIWLVKASTKKHVTFYTDFIIWVSVRLFINIVIVFIFLWMSEKKKIEFVIFFIIAYVFFTTVEVIRISKFTKTHFLDLEK